MLTPEELEESCFSIFILCELDALNDFHEMLAAEPRTGATVMPMVHFPLPEKWNLSGKYV